MNSLHIFLFFVLLAISKVWASELAYQDVRIELFLENEEGNTTPCDNPDNYTLVFKNMKLDSGSCVTHLFPQFGKEDGEKWIQFSAGAQIRADGGLQIWLYFTRDEISGAITYCAEENIQNLPYPLEVAPAKNGACQVLSLPRFTLGDGEEQRSMALRVIYDVNKAKKLLEKMHSGENDESSAVSNVGSNIVTYYIIAFAFVQLIYL